MAKKSTKKKIYIERLSGLLSAKDRREALDVIADSFKGGMRDHMTKALWKGSAFDPEYTRIAVADGRVVSVVVMAPRDVMLGSLTVPAMTVGPVATHADYRKLGYSSAVLNDATEYMAGKSVQLAYLRGPRRFYSRFGYYSYMTASLAKIRVNDAERVGLPGKIRAMKSVDLPTVAKIYKSVTAGRTMVAKRSLRTWEWLLKYGRYTYLFKGPKVILDDKGRICGYVTLNTDGGFRVGELVTKPNERSWCIALGLLAKEGRRQKLDNFVVPVPWTGAMGVFIRQIVGALFYMHSRSTGGDSLKILNMPVLMKTLEPVFKERWKAGGRRERSLQFTLNSELGSVGFIVKGRSVRVVKPGKGLSVKLPACWLSGMLTGCWSVRNVALRKGVVIPEELISVLDVLFPESWPYSYRGDNY